MSKPRTATICMAATVCVMGTITMTNWNKAHEMSFDEAIALARDLPSLTPDQKVAVALVLQGHALRIIEAEHRIRGDAEVLPSTAARNALDLIRERAQ